jgi:hypothetical protein
VKLSNFFVTNSLAVAFKLAIDYANETGFCHVMALPTADDSDIYFEILKSAGSNISFHAETSKMLFHAVRLDTGMNNPEET